MFASKPVAPSTVRIGRGDTLLLYTDGVIEVTDANQDDFGEDRLVRVVSDAAGRPARGIIDALLAATRAHAGRSQYDDDVTLLVVKRLAGGSPTG
jgi:sigma-B regulation protein RsbU (phosphoserine phosphatase)